MSFESVTVLGVILDIVFVAAALGFLAVMITVVKYDFIKGAAKFCALALLAWPSWYSVFLVLAGRTQTIAIGLLTPAGNWSEFGLYTNEWLNVPFISYVPLTSHFSLWFGGMGVFIALCAYAILLVLFPLFFSIRKNHS